MSFWKTVLAVVLGVGIACVIGAIIYDSFVGGPARQAQAQRGWNELDRKMQLDNDELAAKNERLDEEIRELQPGSPCNVLSGADFAQCNDLKTAGEKRKFAAAHRPKH